MYGGASTKHTFQILTEISHRALLNNDALLNPRAKSHLWPVRKCDRNANDGLSSTQLHTPGTHTAPRGLCMGLSRLHGIACMVAAAASDVNRSRDSVLVGRVLCRGPQN